MRRAILFDKDGVLVDNSMYPRPPKAELLPEAVEAFRLLSGAPYALCVVSNQSWIGKGEMTKEEVDAVFETICGKAVEYGARIDGCYYCPHREEDGCSCRKPSPELLLRAAKDLEVCLEQSFMVGDQDSDIIAGQRAGTRTVYVGSRAGKSKPEVVVPNVAEAMHYILSQR
ncbi:HAD-IIIA family hydrolase [Candidatus Woesearchaeota archaeon]|nr:HAD-IIIA family hydrolase [Candidatus Woesearchaeota archaeon]